MRGSTTRRSLNQIPLGSESVADQVFAVTDILNDIGTTLVTPSLSGVNFPGGVQIMAGVYTPWKSVHDTAISAVKSLIAKYPDYTLEPMSHSLGGRLTYMSYIALAQNFSTKSITSNALTAFPISNAAFAAFGTAQTGLLRRGNNVLDGVPVSLAYSGHIPNIMALILWGTCTPTTPTTEP